MLDLNRIRNNTQEVVDALQRKGHQVDFTEVIKWDDERKALITEIEQLNARSINLAIMALNFKTRIAKYAWIRITITL